MSAASPKPPAASPPEAALNESSLEMLLAGPWSEGEYSLVRQQITSCGRVLKADTTAAAIECLADGNVAPELVALAQPRPNYYTQREIDALQHAAPLARIVVVAGSWCEGELRTGWPLSGVIRLYWYETAMWLAAGVGLRAAGKRPSWSEPLDGVRAGQTIDVATAPAAPAGGSLIVDATDYSVFTALETALAPLGWQCDWQPRHLVDLHTAVADAGPIAAVWDGGQLNAKEVASLTAFAMRVHPTPIAALLDFPRTEHYPMVQKAGAAAIVAKPYQVALLARTLNGIVSGTIDLPIRFA